MIPVFLTVRCLEISQTFPVFFLLDMEIQNQDKQKYIIFSTSKIISDLHKM